jgi:4-aminobutyrate aminotransferase
MGQLIMTRLEQMAARHPSIGEIRGRGLMIGIEFVHDRVTKRRAAGLRNDLVQRAFSNGLLLLPCGTNSLRITPPLNIPLPLVEEGLEIFEHVLGVAETRHL